MKLAICVASIFPILSFVVCDAVAATDVAAGLRACANQAEDSLRLACYDKLAARRSDASSDSRTSPTEMQSITKAAAPAQAMVATNPEKNFGLRADQIAKANGTPQVSRIKSKVAKIETRALGRMIITLENEQVWEQKTADSLFYLNVGDEVTIKQGMLGSHILTAPSNRFTNVGRVR